MEGNRIPKCEHQWASCGGLYTLQAGPLIELLECRLCGARRTIENGHETTEEREPAPCVVDLVVGDKVVGRGLCATPPDVVRRYGVGRVRVLGDWRVLRADLECGVGTAGEGDLAFISPEPCEEGDHDFRAPGVPRNPGST